MPARVPTTTSFELRRSPLPVRNPTRERWLVMIATFVVAATTAIARELAEPLAVPFLVVFWLLPQEGILFLMRRYRERRARPFTLEIGPAHVALVGLNERVTLDYDALEVATERGALGLRVDGNTRWLAPSHFAGGADALARARDTIRAAKTTHRSATPHDPTPAS